MENWWPRNGSIPSRNKEEESIWRKRYKHTDIQTESTTKNSRLLAGAESINASQRKYINKWCLLCLLADIWMIHVKFQLLICCSFYCMINKFLSLINSYYWKLKLAPVLKIRDAFSVQTITYSDLHLLVFSIHFAAFTDKFNFAKLFFYICHLVTCVT